MSGEQAAEIPPEDAGGARKRDADAQSQAPRARGEDAHADGDLEQPEDDDEHRSPSADQLADRMVDGGNLPSATYDALRDQPPGR